MVGHLTPHDITFRRDRSQLMDEPGGRFVASQREVCFSHLGGAAHGLRIAARLKLRA